MQSIEEISLVSTKAMRSEKRWNVHSFSVSRNDLTLGWKAFRPACTLFPWWSKQGRVALLRLIALSDPPLHLHFALDLNTKKMSSRCVALNLALITCRQAPSDAYSLDCPFSFLPHSLTSLPHLHSALFPCLFLLINVTIFFKSSSGLPALQEAGSVETEGHWWTCCFWRSLLIDIERAAGEECAGPLLANLCFNQRV